MRRSLFLGFCLLTVLALLLVPGGARADCTSPAKTAGTIEYFSGDDTHKICNGTAWETIALDTASLGACSNANTRDYDTSAKAYKICDGSDYREVKCVTGSGGAGIERISAGYLHSCALQTDDVITCWGEGSNGRLGYGGTADKIDPTEISESGPWIAVDAGEEHSCGIKSDGSAWCWGNGGNGRLGYGGTAQQDDPVEISESGPWVAISAAFEHSFGIKSNGTAWCWGENGDSRLGDGGTTDQNDPVQVSDAGPWDVISAGAWHTCGVQSDGTGWCWGSYQNGRLGIGSVGSNQTDPVQLSESGPWDTISASTNHSCGAKSDGTGWCWGAWWDGRLGIGSVSVHQWDPVQISESGPWDTISAGHRFSCGVKSAGTAWCWGLGNNGQVGTGTGGAYYDPAQVVGSGTWVTLESGVGGFTESQHSCGVKDDDTGWCWGEGSSGQLGYGDTVTHFYPVEAGRLDLPATRTPKGTAGQKSHASSWTALSSVSLSEGDTLLVCVATLGTVTSVTWNGTGLTADATASGTAVGYIYRLADVSAGTGNIVVNMSGSTTSAVAATAVAGLVSSPFDKASTGTGSSDTPSSGATSTTAQADEFVFGCVATNGDVDDAAGIWNNGFAAGQRFGTTGQGPTSNMTASEGWRIVSDTGTYTAAKANISSRDWAAAVATYKINVVAGCESYGACSKPGEIEYSSGNGFRWCDGTDWQQIEVAP